LDRIVRFLNKVIEDSSKAKSSEEVAEQPAKEERAKSSEAQTSYIR
jgi:hypothetical protein